MNYNTMSGNKRKANNTSTSSSSRGDSSRQQQQQQEAPPLLSRWSKEMTTLIHDLIDAGKITAYTTPVAILQSDDHDFDPLRSFTPSILQSNLRNAKASYEVAQRGDGKPSSSSAGKTVIKLFIYTITKPYYNI